jgi:hypothetical protein
LFKLYFFGKKLLIILIIADTGRMRYSVIDKSLSRTCSKLINIPSLKYNSSPALGYTNGKINSKIMESLCVCEAGLALHARKLCEVGYIQ